MVRKRKLYFIKTKGVMEDNTDKDKSEFFNINKLIKENKKLGKNKVFIKSVGSFIQLASFGALIFSPGFVFWQFLLLVLGVELVEDTIVRQIDNKTKKSLENFEKKLNFNSVEGVVIAKYLLDKISILDPDYYSADNLKRLTRNLSRKFKVIINQEKESGLMINNNLTFSSFDIKDYVTYLEQNNLKSDRLINNLNALNIDVKQFMLDISPISLERFKIVEKISSHGFNGHLADHSETTDSSLMSEDFLRLKQTVLDLENKKLNAEQKACLEDIKIDINKIEKIYEGLKNESPQIQKKGVEKVQEIVLYCVEIISEVKTEINGDLFKDIKTLGQHVEKKAMNLKK